MTHRRDFLKSAAALVAGTVLSPRLNAQNVFNNEGEEDLKKLKKIGVQLFSIPKFVEKDFAAAMQKLAQIGYREIEFYGPYSFSANEDKERWNTVTPSLGFSGSGFFGLTVQQVKKILDDNGLSAPSIHTGLATLHNAMDPLAEAAHVLGTRYVILPSAQTQSTVDGAKMLADDFNKIGAEAQKRDIRFAYHNHGNGLKAIEGIVPFDLVLERTDPKLVFFEMDIYWMTAGGVDVSAYLDKYPGRFRLMHVKDMAKEARFSGDGGDSKQWIELFPFLANAGSGVLDLKTILTHAQKSHVEHFIVERDLAPNPTDDLQKSYAYLASLDLDK